jgi:small subunit ribosomal protein S18
MTDRGKIKTRINTGTCAQHQRDVAVAIKTAREMAMLPYVVRTVADDKSGGRKGRGQGRPEDRTTRPDAGAASSNGQEAPDAAADSPAITDNAEMARIAGDA